MAPISVQLVKDVLRLLRGTGWPARVIGGRGMGAGTAGPAGDWHGVLQVIAIDRCHQRCRTAARASVIRLTQRVSVCRHSRPQQRTVVPCPAMHVAVTEPGRPWADRPAVYGRGVRAGVACALRAAPARSTRMATAAAVLARWPVFLLRRPGRSRRPGCGARRLRPESCWAALVHDPARRSRWCAREPCPRRRA